MCFYLLLCDSLVNTVNNCCVIELTEKYLTEVESSVSVHSTWKKIKAVAMRQYSSSNQGYNREEQTHHRIQTNTLTDATHWPRLYEIGHQRKSPKREET